MKSHETRFNKKVDRIFWLMVAILPLLVYLPTYITTGSLEAFAGFIDGYRFEFIANIFDQVFASAFTPLPRVVVSLLSYCVGVEICHVLFDVVVFIPRFAHKLIEKAVTYD